MSRSGAADDAQSARNVNPVMPDPAVYRGQIYGVVRRIHANYLYLRKPLRAFIRLVGFVTLLVILGGIAFSTLYPDPTPPDGAPPGTTSGRWSIS